MDVSSGLEDELLRRASIELNDGSIIWQQREVELPVTFPILGGDDQQHVIIRGHIDGLHQQSDTIIEAKALSTHNYDLYVTGGLDALGSLGKKYKVQGAIYGFATERKVRFVVGEKVRVIPEGTVIDNDDPHPTVATRDIWNIGRVDVGPPIDPSTLHSLDAIIAKVRTIENHASRDELPDCDGNCREGDPYSESHLFAGPTPGDDRLLELIIRRDELKQLLGEEPDPKKDKPGWGILGELAEVVDEIKTDYGDERETKKYTVGPFSVSIVANKGREYIDSYWLKKNHPDIAASATKLGRPFQSLIVKRAKSDKGERDE